jgi:hypothetical protein
MAASETSTPKVDGLESSGLKLGGLGSGGLKMGGFKSSDLKLGGSEVDGPKSDVPTSTSVNVVTSGSSAVGMGSLLVSSEKLNNPFTLSKQQQQQQQPSLVTGTLSPDTQKMNQTGKMDGMGLFAQLKGTPTSGTGLNLTMGSSQFGDLKIKFPTSQPSLLGSTTQPSLPGATTHPPLSHRCPEPPHSHRCLEPPHKKNLEDWEDLVLRSRCFRSKREAKNKSHL